MAEIVLVIAACVGAALAFELLFRTVERRYVRPALVRYGAREMDLPEEVVASRLLNDADWKTFERRAKRQWRLSRAERVEEWARLRAWFAGYERGTDG